MVGSGSLSRRLNMLFLESLATPITSQEIGFDLPTRKRLPRASLASLISGHKLCANVSLTIATGGDLLVSCAVKARPRRSGVQMVSKYLEPTLKSPAKTLLSGGTSRSSGTTGEESHIKHSGNRLVTLAVCTPGSLSTRSTIC